LLQVLDDGRLTDGQGRTVDFRNTLIILTSNLGSDILAAQEEGHDSSEMEGEVMAEVRAAFRPEFLNRLDEIILFHRLFRNQMDGIVEIQLGRLTERLAGRGMGLELDSPAKAWLAQAGYDQAYGARPLKRVIQRSLENPLASLILEDRLREGQTVKVSAGEDGLVIDGLDAVAA
jgi:ATP-dependent Clp protease ATP-binding subunit ClpB